MIEPNIPSIRRRRFYFGVLLLTVAGTVFVAFRFHAYRNEVVQIAIVRDVVVAEAASTVLKPHGIPCGYDGSVAYALRVHRKHAEPAILILRDADIPFILPESLVPQGPRS